MKKMKNIKNERFKFLIDICFCEYTLAALTKLFNDKTTSTLCYDFLFCLYAQSLGKARWELTKIMEVKNIAWRERKYESCFNI